MDSHIGTGYAAPVCTAVRIREFTYLFYTCLCSVAQQAVFSYPQGSKGALKWEPQPQGDGVN